MCGIAGAAGKNIPAGFPAERVLTALRHRGPDGEGFFADEGVALANTRLAVLDSRNPASGQPMRDQSGRYAIVYNGEVGNFREIRAGLEKSGVRFFSDTDTEVVLAAFIKHGEDCLELFRGMFALAVWDCLEKRLFFARDRLGIKPFYYALKNGVFYFASQPKAIFAAGFGPLAPNPAALAYFLQTRHNDLDETIFKGVFKLPPGHRGWFGGGELKIEHWWTLPRFGEGDAGADPDELLPVLAGAVDLNLAGDGPTGLFLSGGLDSSGLLGLMSGRARPVRTFTVEMEGLGASSNLPALCARFGNDARAIPVGGGACGLWPKIVWHYDELNADPASIPLFVMAAEAAKDVKAVCAGEGADELFGGYERIFILNALEKAGKLAPGRVQALVPGLAELLPAKLGDLVFPYYSMLMPESLGRIRVLFDKSENPFKKYLALQSVIMPDETAGLILPSHIEKGRVRALAESVAAPFLEEAGRGGSLPGLMRFEAAKRLVTDLLMKSDCMTMAHGLECRVPYLDHKVVEFAAKIPLKRQVGLRCGKKFLRAALAPVLPPSVIRQRKENFFVPIHKWLAGMRPLAEKMLSEKNIARQGMLDPAAVAGLVGKYRAGRLYYARIVWNLLTYAVWHDIFIDKGGAYPGG